MSIVIDHWKTNPGKDTESSVIPDGCRDVIVKNLNGTLSLFVSPLFVTTLPVKLQANESMEGYRLAPGTQLDEQALLCEAGKDYHKLSASLITACSMRSSNIDEYLSCIKEQPVSINRISRSLGVSQRSLQREISKRTGKPPVYWLRLTRARQSAMALATSSHLSEIPYDFGYSDQAHFCREIKHWFGVTPVQLLHRKDLTDQLDAPAY